MAISELAELCRKCILSRSSATEFAAQVSRRRGLSGRLLSKALIDTRAAICPPNDPLPPRYLTAILTSQVVVLSDVVLALIARYSNATRDLQNATADIFQADVKTLQDATILVVSAKLSLDRTQTERCLLLLSRWLQSLTGPVHQQGNAALQNLIEATGSLLATLSATTCGVELLSEQNESKNQKAIKFVGGAVQAVLGSFPTVSAQLANRLGEVQKHIALFTQQGSADMQAMQFQAGVGELQVVATRAGTTALLQERIERGYTVDDNSIFNFLAGRHANDYSAMFLDLLFASFHILGQSQGLVLQQIELYIRNRLPSALALISQSSFETFSAEQALTTAWSQLQLNASALPCAQRFIHACSLQGLIDSDKATQLIDNQELGSTLSKRLYTKDEIVTQLNGSPATADKLIGELMTGEANGVVISQAIVELIAAYARRKETHHLKDLAQLLVRKTDAINAISLFHRPALWISPLCTLLDEWSWDDIHGESQPLYDEFGSILLLIITTRRRLGHSITKLGITGFVAKYLDQEGVERPWTQLSQEEDKHFNAWIDALYLAESLSDDLTTNCSPRDFYMLVPTLMRSSVLAFQKGKLTQDDLKGGLEYLLEQFLLPSLVSALHWCEDHPRANEGALIKPILTRDSDNEIHRIVVSMMQSKDFAFPRWDVTDLQKLRNDITAAVAGPESNLSLKYAVTAYGASRVLQTLLDILLSFSGSNDFILALDLIATLVCATDAADLRLLIQVRVAKLGDFLKKRDTMTAEALVHLYRRVEVYNSLLVVEEPTIDLTTLAAMTPTETLVQNDANNAQPVDDIDQVLNESAAINESSAMDAMNAGLDSTMDGGMSAVDDFDSFYLQDDNMGLGNLDDLDLDMF